MGNPNSKQAPTFSGAPNSIQNRIPGPVQSPVMSSPKTPPQQMPMGNGGPIPGDMRNAALATALRNGAGTVNPFEQRPSVPVQMINPLGRKTPVLK